MVWERKRGRKLATNDPRRVIGVPVARVGIDFIPRRRILRQRELESRGNPTSSRSNSNSSSSNMKSWFRYIGVACIWHASHIPWEIDVRVDDPETPSLLINVNVPRQWRGWRVPFFASFLSRQSSLLSAAPRENAYLSSSRFFTTPKEEFSSPRTHREGRRRWFPFRWRS